VTEAAPPETPTWSAVVPEPQKMQFVTVRVLFSAYTPWLLTKGWLAELLSEKVQFVTVGEPVELDIPPP
jgi:hypothetical protein